MNPIVEFHLKQLQLVYPQVKRCNENGTKLKIGLKIADNILSILILLPDTFPQAPPALSFDNAVVNHPWVDDSGRIIGVNSLYSWNITSKLVDVVKEALQYFIKVPPKIIKMKIKQIQQDNNNVKFPIDYSEINNLTLSELKELTESEEKFDAFLNGLSCMKPFQDNPSQIENENNKIASDILLKEEKLNKFKLEVNLLKEEVNQMQGKLLIINHEVSELSSQWSKQEISNRLKDKSEILNKESIEVFQHYLEDELEENTFVQQYFKIRSDLHRIQAKIRILSMS